MAVEAAGDVAAAMLIEVDAGSATASLAVVAGASHVATAGGGGGTVVDGVAAEAFVAVFETSDGIAGALTSADAGLNGDEAGIEADQVGESSVGHIVCVA